ncbi:MAG: hypothetical protein ACHQHN_02485 [Sphingobacteriales bacterium]
MEKRLPFIALLVFMVSCSVRKTESVMPFYNFGYEASRLQPVILSDAAFEFRIWINNGTSIERVISISKDSTFGTESYFDEIGILSHKWKNQFFYKKTKMLPESGVEGFIAKLDSMKIAEVETQKEKDIPPHGMHEPFSLYVVEYKKFDKYHCFKFYTVFPYKSNDETKYTQIEKLIRNEFKYNFYFK